MGILLNSLKLYLIFRKKFFPNVHINKSNRESSEMGRPRSPRNVSLKDVLDLGGTVKGDVIDLSHLTMDKVPVSEIARLPRGTTLDLSNNYFTTITHDFVLLTHLVKLDLSRNCLEELPTSFGELKALKHLDLYSNNLKDLPLSFANLQNLKWLDLKNNPLNPELKKATGACNTPFDCALCAKNVLALLQNKQVQEELKALTSTKRGEEEEDILFIEERKKDRVVEEILISEDDDENETPTIGKDGSTIQLNRIKKESSYCYTPGDKRRFPLKCRSRVMLFIA